MIKHAALPLATIPLAAILLAGCPLVDAEVEIGEVCLSYRDLEIEGAAAGSYDLVIDDLAALHDLLDHDAELTLSRAELRATSGVGDLRFVEAARLSLASGDPDATLPTLAAYDCAGDCAVAGRTLTLPTAVERDVVDYLRGNAVVVGVAIDGELPAGRWTMDVDVCLRGRVRETLEP